MYSLEVIRDSKLKTGAEIERLIGEANELTAIFTATDKTVKQRKLNQTHKSHIGICIYREETEY